MNYTEEQETHTVGYIEIDGKKFAAWSLKRILEDLSETDHYFNRIVIHDSSLEDVLEAREVIWKSVRGSVAKGKNYEAFVKEFEAATGYEVERD